QQPYASLLVFYHYFPAHPCHFYRLKSDRIFSAWVNAAAVLPDPPEYRPVPDAIQTYCYFPSEDHCSRIGSGRRQSQIATISMVRSVKILTPSGAVVNNMMIPLISIMILASHLALRGTVPLARQSRKVGPYLGSFNNQSSICGQPLDAAQAARI